MHVLKSTDTLKVTTTGAFALNVVVDYIDRDGEKEESGRQITMMTTATTSVVCAAPPSVQIERKVKSVSLYASGVGSQGATVSLDDGTSNPKLAIVALVVDQCFQYEDGRGWKKMLVTGAEAAAA